MLVLLPTSASATHSQSPRQRISGTKQVKARFFLHLPRTSTDPRPATDEAWRPRGPYSTNTKQKKEKVACLVFHFLSLRSFMWSYYAVFCPPPLPRVKRQEVGHDLCWFLWWRVCVGGWGGCGGGASRPIPSHPPGDKRLYPPQAYLVGVFLKGRHVQPGVWYGHHLHAGRLPRMHLYI